MPGIFTILKQRARVIRFWLCSGYSSCVSLWWLWLLFHTFQCDGGQRILRSILGQTMYFLWATRIRLSLSGVCRVRCTGNSGLKYFLYSGMLRSTVLTWSCVVYGGWGFHTFSTWRRARILVPMYLAVTCVCWCRLMSTGAGFYGRCFSRVVCNDRCPAYVLSCSSSTRSCTLLSWRRVLSPWFGRPQRFSCWRTQVCNIFATATGDHRQRSCPLIFRIFWVCPFLKNLHACCEYQQLGAEEVGSDPMSEFQPRRFPWTWVDKSCRPRGTSFFPSGLSCAKSSDCSTHCCGHLSEGGVGRVRCRSLVGWMPRCPKQKRRWRIQEQREKQEVDEELATEGLWTQNYPSPHPVFASPFPVCLQRLTWLAMLNAMARRLQDVAGSGACARGGDTSVRASAWRWPLPREMNSGLRAQTTVSAGSRKAALQEPELLVGRLGAPRCPGSGVPSLALAVLGGGGDGVDASCLAFLVRRAVEDKKKEEERKKKVKRQHAQIIEKVLWVQERTQESLRMKRKKKRKRLPRASSPVFAAALEATPVLACVFADFWNDFFCSVTSSAAYVSSGAGLPAHCVWATGFFSARYATTGVPKGSDSASPFSPVAVQLVVDGPVIFFSFLVVAQRHFPWSRLFCGP